STAPGASTHPTPSSTAWPASPTAPTPTPRRCGRPSAATPSAATPSRRAGRHERFCAAETTSTVASASENLEVDDLLGLLDDLVDGVGPGAGGQVLPAAVGQHDHDHAVLAAGSQLAGRLGRAGHGRPGRDPAEDARLGRQPAGPLDRLPGAHDDPP